MIVRHPYCLAAYMLNTLKVLYTDLKGHVVCWLGSGFLKNKAKSQGKRNGDIHWLQNTWLTPF